MGIIEDVTEDVELKVRLPRFVVMWLEKVAKLRNETVDELLTKLLLLQISTLRMFLFAIESAIETSETLKREEIKALLPLP
jgi:hypothetical protein